MKLLSFDIRRNLKKPPRIHVKSATSGMIYGSFQADETESFEGWKLMSEAEIIELKHYMDNLNAVKRHLGDQALNEQSDYRLRLPLRFMEALDEISAICHGAGMNIDIFEPILSAIIQEVKIVTAKLEGEHKTKVLAILDRVGIAEYQKIDQSRQIKAIFSELLSIQNKSEKLHAQAKAVFDKDKSYSPKAIESMASGETIPSKWLVACAISVLAHEKTDILKTILSDDDLLMLFAKPLIENDKKTLLLELTKKYKLNCYPE